MNTLVELASPSVTPSDKATIPTPCVRTTIVCPGDGTMLILPRLAYSRGAPPSIWTEVHAVAKAAMAPQSNATVGPCRPGEDNIKRHHMPTVKLGNFSD